MKTKAKEYLGDGVYAQLNGYGELVLTTENSVEVTNTILLEPEVQITLLRYMEAKPNE